MVTMVATFTEGSIFGIFAWGVATATKKIDIVLFKPQSSEIGGTRSFFSHHIPIPKALRN